VRDDGAVEQGRRHSRRARVDRHRGHCRPGAGSVRDTIDWLRAEIIYERELVPGLAWSPVPDRCARSRQGRPRVGAGS
jgi:hypothetical protein